MSFLKVQVSFRSSVASIFSAIKYNSSILYLAQTLYTLVKGSPLKCKFLRFLSAPVKIHQSPHLNFETTSQFLLQFCIFFIVMTNSSPVSFKLIHFLLWFEKNPKDQILRLSSALAKISQIPYVIFESKSQFSFKFCINIQCHQT